MMTDAVIVFPPLSDFSQPPEIAASLSAAIKASGHRVLAVDMNLRAVASLLTPPRVEALIQMADARLCALMKRSSLTFWEQGELLALAPFGANNEKLLDDVQLAADVFHQQTHFYQRREYQQASSTVGEIFKLVSALAFPFDLSTDSIGAPFLVDNHAAVARFRAVDPFRLVIEKLILELHHERPSFIAIPLIDTAQFLPAMTLAAELKERMKGVLLALCGPWTEQLVAAQDSNVMIFLHQFFDVIAMYDAEQVLPILAGMARDNSLRPMVGAHFRAELNVSGKPQAQSALAVATLPVPDYSDFTLSDYFSPETVLSYRPTRHRHLSRTSMNYVGLTQTSLAPRIELSAEQVVQQLLQLQAKLQVQNFQLCGDWLSAEWVTTFAQALIEENVQLRFGVDVILDAPIQTNVAELWRHAGCVTVTFGINENRDRQSPDEGRNTLGVLVPTLDAFAHVQIAVQLIGSLGFPGENEEHAKETLALLRHHHQQIGTFVIREGLQSPPLPFAIQPEAFGSQALLLKGDELRFFPNFDLPVPLLGNGLSRLLFDLNRFANHETLAERRAPFAGAIGTPHTFLYFLHQGRRSVTPLVPRKANETHGVNDQDRLQTKFPLKVVWMPYPLSALREIAAEENDLRDRELGRRMRDLHPDAVWNYSLREDVKIRAGQRLPYVMLPGKQPLEIPLGVANFLAQINEQPQFVSQILGKLPRESRESFRRVLSQLYHHGLINVERSSRRNGDSQKPFHVGQPQSASRHRRRHRGRAHDFSRMPGV